VNSAVYTPSLRTNVGVRQTQITNAIQTAIPNMLQNVWNEFDYRIDIIQASEVGHIEHL